MKNSLLYILAFSTVILFSCKKEEENTDPWKDIDFTRVYSHTITLDSDNNIKGYSRSVNNGTSHYQISYSGNTSARIIGTNNNVTISDISYSLNADGYANYLTGYYNSGGLINPIVEVEGWHFYNQGFEVKNTGSISGINSDTLYSINDGNNITESIRSGVSTFYTYADTLSKVDIWKFDNELTGKNNRNLIKQISDTETPSQGNMVGDTYYYYILNNQGYVTSYYTKFVDHSHGEAVTYKRYNFTYEFE